MRSSLLISLSALLFLVPAARAQLAPAEDFFNRGAQAYISNNIPAALTQVEMGLKLYPDDDQLKKLEKLLKQQQKQNQQQQKKQNQKKQSSQKSGGQKNQSKQNQQSSQNQDQKNQADQKQNEPQKKAADQKKNDQKKSAAEKSADKKDGQKKSGQPEQMTPAEAKHLLDAQKGNEQILQMKPPDKPADTAHPIKDW